MYHDDYDDDDLDAQRAGFADYLGDAIFFMFCLGGAIALVYLIVPMFRPDLWRLL